MIEKLKVKNIIIGIQPETTENYTKFLNKVNKRKIKLISVGVDALDNPNKIIIEKNIYLNILWPKDSNLITENPLNNNSIVCKLNYKSFSMLFTGDIEEVAEKEILQFYKSNLEIINADVLKVSHHGSNTSSTLDFLEAVKPKISVIGVGKANKFGHPNEEVLEALDFFRMQNIKN